MVSEKEAKPRLAERFYHDEEKKADGKLLLVNSKFSLCFPKPIDSKRKKI